MLRLNPFEIRVSFELNPTVLRIMLLRSQSLRNQGFIRTNKWNEWPDVEPSQSLRNQGFIRTIYSLGSRRQYCISIPSKSGFHSNSPMECAMAFPRSQSLRNQGFIRTANQANFAMHRASQSLRNQGFIRTMNQNFFLLPKDSLNPFVIRVSFEPLFLNTFLTAMMSQSLRNQGFIRTAATLSRFLQLSSREPFPT